MKLTTNAHTRLQTFLLAFACAAVLTSTPQAVGGPGDCDGDGDVDLGDFFVFQTCFTGSGTPAAPGCECVDFDGDGDVDLADFLSFQTAFTGPTPYPEFLLKSWPTDVRVVSYNVNWDSIFPDNDPNNHDWREFDMVEEFRRVVVALEPDVLCLQEINEDRDPQCVADILDDVLPLGGGQYWQASIGSDDVICSRWPLSMPATDTIPSTNRGQAMALVDLPDDVYATDVYIMNAHCKAGGSSSDIQRRQQHGDAIANWIRDIETPGEHIDLPQGTPVIVLGDLNAYDTDPHYHVTTIVTGDIVYEATYGSDVDPDWDDTHITDILPTHNAEGVYTYTWRSDGSSYNPGPLDRIIYTDSVSGNPHSFVLNTTLMSSSDLGAAGLETNDVVLNPATGYFDHLPLVADFTFSLIGE